MYKVTSLSVDSTFNFTADSFGYNGDYLFLYEGTNTHIINLAKTVSVEIKEVGEDGKQST